MRRSAVLHEMITDAILGVNAKLKYVCLTKIERPSLGVSWSITLIHCHERYRHAEEKQTAIAVDP
jgi:hypothetical protein